MLGRQAFEVFLLLNGLFDKFLRVLSPVFELIWHRTVLLFRLAAVSRWVFFSLADAIVEGFSVVGWLWWLVQGQKDPIADLGA